PGHAGRILANYLEELANMIAFGRSVEQGFGVALNGGQWRAQFVRNVGDEIAARLLHALGLGKIAQDSNRSSSRHRRCRHVEGAAGDDRVGTRRSDRMVLHSSLDGGK